MTTLQAFGRRHHVYLVLAIGILCISFSAIFVSLADVPGPVAAFGRMLVTVLLLTPIALRRWRRDGRSWRQREVHIAALAGILFAADIALWSTGITLSGATTPTIMGNTAPLWVGLGALFFFREQLRPAFWAGLLLTIMGALLILGLDTLQDLSLGLGTLLGLLAGMFYAGYFLLTQRGRQNLDSLTFFWVAALSGFVFLAFIMLAPNLTLRGYPPATYLYLLALGLVAQVGGHMALNYTLGYLSASIVAPAGLLQPILTAFWAVLLLGESLTIWHLVGGATIISGIYIVMQARRAPA